jgi:hypothetical protein
VQERADLDRLELVVAVAELARERDRYRGDALRATSRIGRSYRPAANWVLSAGRRRANLAACASFAAGER